MRSASAVLALVIGLVVMGAGCGPEQGALRAPGAEDGWVYAPPIPYEPTKDRPIIVKHRDLVFGGEEGKGQDRIKWPSRPVAVAVSPSSQIGAALIASVERGTVLQTYDANRKLLSSVQLVKEDYAGYLSIADDGFAVVNLTMRLADYVRQLLVEGPGKPEPQLPLPAEAVRLVAPDGNVEALAIDGELLRIFALAGKRWVACYKVEDARYRISLFRGKLLGWSVELPEEAEPAVPVFWVERSGDLRIGVQGRTYLRRFDLEGNMVESETLTEVSHDG